MDKKKILIIGAVVAILLSIAVVIHASNKEEHEPEFTIDGINLPTNKDILKDAEVNKLTVTDVSLIMRDGISNFKATVKNETERDATIKKLYVVFYEGEEEHQVLGLYDTKILKETEVYIDITSETDLTNTTKIEYIIE